MEVHTHTKLYLVTNVDWLSPFYSLAKTLRLPRPSPSLFLACSPSLPRSLPPSLPLFFASCFFNVTPMSNFRCVPCSFAGFVICIDSALNISNRLVSGSTHPIIEAAPLFHQNRGIIILRTTATHTLMTILAHRGLAHLTR